MSDQRVPIRWIQREAQEPVVGCLWIDAESPDEVAEIAGGLD